ncbi:hypothetical protein RIF29_29155 [Crotalaria pallida]|uniref:Uncharacterized protein n=1 Tax=Crotalaria pallida TaxID=3830 RepID=A0AAN9EGD0_CROPI
MFHPGAMALHHHQLQKPHKLGTIPLSPLQTHLETIPPWQPHRGVHLPRRRKVQAVRLGGKKPRRGILKRFVRIFSRMRIKWLKLQYVMMLKKLKEHYRNLLKKLDETGNTIETLMFMESTTVIPGSITISGCPSRYGSHRPTIISV